MVGFFMVMNPIPKIGGLGRCFSFSFRGVVSGELAVCKLGGWFVRHLQLQDGLNQQLYMGLWVPCGHRPTYKG